MKSFREFIELKEAGILDKISGKDTALRLAIEYRDNSSNDKVRTEAKKVARLLLGKRKVAINYLEKLYKDSNYSSVTKMAGAILKKLPRL